ncbi:hypothetical protein ABPG72_016142 [Tetrahymena utriculariae]
MSDQYFINDYGTEKSFHKMNLTSEKAAQRKRFDSISTNSSSSDGASNQQQKQQTQYDSRFEPRQIPDIQQVKKSFLSSQYTNPNNNNPNTKSTASMGCSSISSTGKRGSSISSTCISYQIILAVRINSDDQDEEAVYRCFPEVEMTLEDDLTVESVTREAIDKLNQKMVKDLQKKSKAPYSVPKSCELIHPVNGSEECFEICQASKNGEPKGCSFDRNQTLRLIKCKSRLCLKVLDMTAIDPIIFKLLKKQPRAIKEFPYDVSPIQEQDDDQHSIARATSHYKDSLIQKELDVPTNYHYCSTSSFSQPTRSSQTSTINQRQEASIVHQTSNCAPKKKTSFFTRLFRCSVICQ